MWMGSLMIIAFDLVNAGIFVWLENFYAVDNEPSDKELPLVFFAVYFQVWDVQSKQIGAATTTTTTTNNNNNNDNNNNYNLHLQSNIMTAFLFATPCWTSGCQRNARWLGEQTAPCHTLPVYLPCNFHFLASCSEIHDTFSLEISLAKTKEGLWAWKFRVCESWFAWFDPPFCRSRCYLFQMPCIGAAFIYWANGFLGEKMLSNYTLFAKK